MDTYYGFVDYDVWHKKSQSYHQGGNPHYLDSLEHIHKFESITCLKFLKLGPHRKGPSYLKQCLREMSSSSFKIGT